MIPKQISKTGWSRIFFKKIHNLKKKTKKNFSIHHLTKLTIQNIEVKIFQKFMYLEFCQKCLSDLFFELVDLL